MIQREHTKALPLWDGTARVYTNGETGIIALSIEDRVFSRTAMVTLKREEAESLRAALAEALYLASPPVAQGGAA